MGVYQVLLCKQFAWNLFVRAIFFALIQSSICVGDDANFSLPELKNERDQINCC